MAISTGNLERFVQNDIIDAGLQLNRTDGSKLSRQLLLDEAERRGWQSFNLSANLTLFKLDGKSMGGLLHHMPSTIGRVGDEICKSKSLEKKLYEVWGIPTPRSRSFSATQYQEALAFFNTNVEPVVVKPARGSMGSGISVGVQTVQEFEEAWGRATSRHGDAGVVLVEEFLERIDTRVLVVDGSAVAASTRVPPFVVGNGTDSFADLLRSMKKERSLNGYLKKHPVRLDSSWLVQNSVDNETVLEAGRIFFVNLTSNASRGGLTINTTSVIDSSLKRLAESVSKVVPGTPILGVDIFSRSLSHDEGAVVLETNSTPQIGVHHEVSYGSTFDAAGVILDQMVANYKD